MLKLASAFTKRFLFTKNELVNPQIRLFLSESFHLKDAWTARLQSPILQKINISDIFYELDNQFQHFASASALDIDLFVNAVNDDSCFDEVEDVVHKLRLSPEAINILPSTHHALIRLYMNHEKTDDLLRVLDDRLNYGIFSDDYCSLLMMDTFIKKGNFRDAAKVSILGMFQEDASNPLVNYMSLYSCHKYLEDPVSWKPANNEQKEEDDDDEVVKVRVRYIRNPFFDDHFDLVDPNHLIGKTLTFIGSEINDQVGRTYVLLGLLLHGKFNQAKEYVKASATKESPIFVKDGLTFAKVILDQKYSSEVKDESLEAKINELRDLIEKFITDSQLVGEGKLLDMVDSRLKDLVSKHETSEMNKQLELYKEWEENRAQLLMEQIAKLNREKQLAEVKRQKQLLQEKEEELFFFDNEEKLDIILEEKEKKTEEQRQRLLGIIPETDQKTRRKRIIVKNKPDPPLESFFDENIPMELVKTKL